VYVNSSQTDLRLRLASWLATGLPIGAELGKDWRSMMFPQLPPPSTRAGNGDNFGERADDGRIPSFPLPPFNSLWEGGQGK